MNLAKYAPRLLEIQQAIISAIALETDPRSALVHICAGIESVLDGANVRSSVLILEDGHLFHGAAPSLPSAFIDSIDGVAIGPGVGSCGTAAYREETVVVEDTSRDPLWSDFRTLALESGLHACWSTPIFDPDNKVLGTLAIYYDQPTRPTSQDCQLVDYFVRLAALALEKRLTFIRENVLVENLRSSNLKLTAFADAMPELAYVLSAEGIVKRIYGDPGLRADRLTGRMEGHHISDALDEAPVAQLMDLIQRTLESRTPADIELVVQSLWGDDVFDPPKVFEARSAILPAYDPTEPELDHVVILLRDATERVMSAQEVERLAFFDPLTGLANRRLLNDRLTMAVARNQREGNVVAVLYLDIDDFKRINDVLGHTVGDELLVSLSQRLQSILRSSDSIARMGGDEFVFVVESRSADENVSAEHAASLARKILENLAEPFHLEDNAYRIAGSIGISMINSTCSGPEEAIKQADTAMYGAKRQGGNRFTFFESAMQVAANERLETERAMHAGVSKREFEAYFQPQLDKQGELVGMEALARWHRPGVGVVSPGLFIPIAERIGYMGDIQDTILEQSCQLLCELHLEGAVGDRFSLSINISASQFDSELESRLLHIIDRYGLSAENFILEITESLLMDSNDQAIQVMQGLSATGFRFSIDDFGTGYSSLAYLHRLPIHELKIDKAFIDRICDRHQGSAIVDTIIALSRHLECDVIAEGVETAEQVEQLSRRDVKGMQGYIFARPMAAGALLAWLRERASGRRQASC